MHKAAYAATLAFAAGCNGTKSPHMSLRHAYTVPHVLRMSAGDIDGLNPHVNGQTVGTALTMAWLLKTGKGNEPVPELATVVPTKRNGGISHDGHTITYHLRRGVRWSDGAPFDAADVVFSIHAVQDAANNELSRSGWDAIASVATPDRYTVVLHLARPFGAYAYRFFSSQNEGSNPCILPKHLLAKLPNINRAAYNALPVGIGPFRYARWSRSQSVELAANPYYFRGLPRLRRIVFEILPSSNTAFVRMQSHDLDSWLVVPNYVDSVRGISGLTVVRLPGAWVSRFDLNVSRPALHERAVREALRLALDRATLLRMRRGLGVVQDNLVPPTSPAFDATVPTSPFDPRRANGVLDRLGWAWGADGVRHKAGVPLNLQFVTTAGSPSTDALLELVRLWWKRIGVTLEIKRYNAAVLFGSFADGGILATGKYDVAALANTTDPTGDLGATFACNQIPPAGANWTRYCDRDLDTALQRLEAGYSFSERRPYAHFIQTQLQREIPTIVTIVRDNVFAYNSDLKGFHPNSLSMFDDFMNVDI